MNKDECNSCESSGMVSIYLARTLRKLPFLRSTSPRADDCYFRVPLRRTTGGREKDFERNTSPTLPFISLLCFLFPFPFFVPAERLISAINKLTLQEQLFSFSFRISRRRVVGRFCKCTLIVCDKR